MVSSKARVIVMAAVAVVVLAAGGLFWSMSAEAADVTVYALRTCGCCHNWVEHLENNGFTVRVEYVPDVGPVKAEHGVSNELSSCHTALIGDYVVEGHVPARVIRRLLEERPAVRGIAVPGMPVGSPGMEGPYQEPYDVVTFDAAGNTSVFESIR